jgi:hypothetical protein
VFSQCELPKGDTEYLRRIIVLCRGRDSSVGIATGYGLDGLGLFHMSRSATQPPVQWVLDLFRG